MIEASVAIGIMLAVMGVMFILFGSTAGRTGDTPYCGRCNFNLTGKDLTQSDARCNECGADVSRAEAVVIGEKRIASRPIIVGVMLILFGVTPPLTMIGTNAISVSWIQYQPTGWLISDSTSASIRTADNAVAELKRRGAAGRLSSEERRNWIGALLAKQTTGSADTVQRRHVDSVLDQMVRAGGLSPADETRFFDNLLKTEIRCRASALKDQPFMFEFLPEFPDYLGYSCWVRLGPWSSDGHEVAPRLDRDRRPERMMLPISISGVGKQDLTVQVTCDIFDLTRVTARSSDTKPTEKPLRTIKRTLSAPIEVFATEPAGWFKLTHSAELDNRVLSGMTLSDFGFGNRISGAPPRPLAAALMLPPNFPIGMALDVTVEYNGRLLGFERIVYVPGERTGPWLIPIGNSPIAAAWMYHLTPLPNQAFRDNFMPPSVTVIVRSARDAALLYSHMSEIWDGEMRFEKVRVVVPSPSLRPPALSYDEMEKGVRRNQGKLLRPAAATEP